MHLYPWPSGVPYQRMSTSVNRMKIGSWAFFKYLTQIALELFDFSLRHFFLIKPAQKAKFAGSLMPISQWINISYDLPCNGLVSMNNFDRDQHDLQWQLPGE